jgi:predicted dehydrogenase
VSAPVRLALVGCGAAAERCHVPGLSFVPQVRLTALVDPVEAHARRLRDQYAALGGDAGAVRVATDVAQVAGEVDAAVVASPHDTHLPLALALAGAGVHCLVEKPMGMSEAECVRMAEAARRAGVVMGVAHVRRLFPASPWVRRLLRAGALGRVERIRWREGAPYEWPLTTPSLFTRSVSGGGVLADGGPHVLDLLLWWMDADGAEVVEVRDSGLGGAESEAVVRLRMAGADVRVELSRLRMRENTCVIHGSEGQLEVGIDTEAPYTRWDAGGRVVEEGIVPAEPPAQAGWEMLFAEQLRNLAAAVRGTEAVYADAEDGRRVVRLIERCYAARQPLDLPWRDLEAA